LTAARTDPSLRPVPLVASRSSKKEDRIVRTKLLVLTALVLLVSTPTSAAVGRGTSLFSLQLSHGTADLTSDAGGGYITAYDHSEIGAGAQFWHLFSDNYAFALSGGVGFFSEKDEPGTAAPPGSSEFKYTQSSFFVRAGGDRMVQVGDQALLYFGPGFEFWSGKATFDADTPTEDEREPTKRFSISGRIGGIMTIGPSWGLHINVGRKIGYATVEQDGAKATWWPSSVDAQSGIVFVFGGGQ
jgi:outer membrane protein with beta-barrel domain